MEVMEKSDSSSWLITGSKITIGVGAGLLAGGWLVGYLVNYGYISGADYWFVTYLALATGGTVTLMVGAVAGVVAVIFPTDANAGEMTDYFLTPEGFVTFQSLPREEKLIYFELDPQFGEFYIAVADQVAKAQGRSVDLGNF